MSSRKKFLAFLGFLLSIATLFAQDFQDQFKQFKSQDEKDFELAKQQQDSIFARSIIENWKAIQLEEPVEKQSEPKPERQPELDPELELEDLEHKFIDTQPKLMRSFSPTSTEYNQVYEPELEEQFDFYGETIQVRYSSRLLLADRLQIKNQHDLAKAWQVLSKLPYQSVIKALNEKQEEMQLPDYGYLMLVGDFLSTLDISSENAEVFKWFLLVKSGFLARLGLIDEVPVLVVGSFGKLYGKRYYSSAGINYYVLSDRQGSLESYIVDTDSDSNPLDFSIRQAVRLPLDPVTKKINYTSKTGRSISIDVIHNRNMIKMLAKFPQADLAYHLSSSSSKLLSKSLETSLSPYLNGKSTFDKVSFLLEFVQKGFDYQSDTRQFGKERVLYPDELFHYPYSDCDDRVVLLAYLLRMFVDLPMIAVGFPQHVALALKLSGPVYGEHVTYNGYQFTFCDPTYANAPLGSIIPSADRSAIKVIEF